MRSIKSLFLLTLAFGVVTLNSCKKDTDTTEAKSATVSASVDGTATNFNTNALAVKGSANGVTLTSINGTAANKASISITLNGTVTAGKTYSNTASNDDDKPLLVYATADDEQYFNDDDSSTNPVSVTITSVSSTAIAGTFKGDLIDISASNNTKTKSITNGKFNVKITK